MTDPTPKGSPAQFRSLYRSLILDPDLLFADALDGEELARVVAEEAGPSRDRIFTPFVTTAVFLSQVLSDDHSCRGAVARLLAWRVARGLPACSPDAGGYCKARLRLPESLLPRLVRLVADRVGAHAPEAWTFHGRRVVIADGSGVSMPDTPENQAQYPQHSAQKRGCGFPIARIVVLISLATGCVLDAALCGGRGKLTGEHALLRGLHGRLIEGDILLGDSYYSSFDEVVTLAGMGVDVVMRQHGGRPSDFRRGTRLGRQDHLVVWHRHRNRPDWMGRQEFAALPRELAMRELRVRVGKPGFRTKSFVVVTTLLDPAAFPAVELASLYRQRWHAELDIRSLKIAMRMDVLRCKTPAMVRKEFCTPRTILRNAG
jgi:Transposase DDE domain